MRRPLFRFFFFRGCVECPASVGGNIFCIKRLTSPSLCFSEASLEFGFAVLLGGSACACVRLHARLGVPHGGAGYSETSPQYLNIPSWKYFQSFRNYKSLAELLLLIQPFPGDSTTVFRKTS